MPFLETFYSVILHIKNSDKILLIVASINVTIKDINSIFSKKKEEYGLFLKSLVVVGKTLSKVDYKYQVNLKVKFRSCLPKPLIK